MDDVRILLDEPADRPVLHFDRFAQAFAGIIRNSEPRFAIGIFGAWGSGKTTLMRAIKRELDADDHIVTLWFNAWRYEREEHLIVPLLDVLREALVDWAEREEWARDQSLRDRAVQAAATVAKAAGAILAGLSVTAQAPGLAELAFDSGKAMADWRERAEEAAKEPRSLYHASFRALQRAFDQFVGHDKQRIVVFVDDLDRCLPASALEVLESMKLFFDLPGFVFVVGLDREVVQRAIEVKYRSMAGGGGAEQDTLVKGSEYVKKIFQIPFVLPPVSPHQIKSYLESFDHPQAGLSERQLEDLRTTVRAHIGYLVGDAGVNPREVKRYVNAYTLRCLIDPKLDRDVILCLQTLDFREDWRLAYEVLLAEREAFTDAVRRRLDGDPAAVENLWPELAGVAPELFAYLDSPGGRPLLEVPSLDLYLHSMEVTWSTHPGLLDAYRELGDLRGILRGFVAAASDEQRRKLQSDFGDRLPGLLGQLRQLPESEPTARLLADVEEAVRRLEPEWAGPIASDDAEEEHARLEAWHRAASEVLVQVQLRLREVRQLVTVQPGG